MLIRSLHAEKVPLFFIRPFTHNESAEICPQPLVPAPPLPLFIFPLSPQSLISSSRPLCVLQSLQQSSHLENPQLQNSISSDTNTIIKRSPYKGAIKTGEVVFSGHRLFEQTSKLDLTACLCPPYNKFQCFLSKCFKVFILKTHADLKTGKHRKETGQRKRWQHLCDGGKNGAWMDKTRYKSEELREDETWV